MNIEIMEQVDTFTFILDEIVMMEAGNFDSFEEFISHVEENYYSEIVSESKEVGIWKIKPMFKELWNEYWSDYA